MPASSRPLNYTTGIAPARTVSECQDILARSGAAQVAVDYRDGRPCGLSFRLDTPHGSRHFTLPCDIDGMHAVLEKAERDGMFTAARKKPGTFSGREHAERVAWRVMKDWLEATLALVAAGMARLDEAMLPYLHVDGDRTLYQAYRAREDALELEDGRG